MSNLEITEEQPRYAMVVIDTFTNFGETWSMQNKGNGSVYNALLIIFQKMGYPVSIYSDDDEAFKSKVKDFL